MSNGNPIIIKDGGSIEIFLSKDTFPQDSENSERHYSPDRRITQVVITDDATGKITAIPGSGKLTVSIEHKR